MCCRTGKFIYKISVARIAIYSIRIIRELRSILWYSGRQNMGKDQFRAGHANGHKFLMQMVIMLLTFSCVLHCNLMSLLPVEVQH